MTISANYTPTSVAGNGVTSVFTGGWPIFVAANLLIELVNATTGARTTQVQGTAYLLTFNSSGWVATFQAGYIPPTGYNVVGSRVIPLTQGVPYSTSEGFDGTQQENSFDQLTGMVQDLQDDLNRSPQFPVGSGITDIALPIPSAGLALIWNSDGTALINSQFDPDTAATEAAASAAAALVSQNAAASSAATASTAATTASTASTTASAAQVSASASAVAAAASAAAAAASFIGTSTTSNSIGTGSKTFTTQSGLSINPGSTFVTIASSASPTNYMVGQVTAYSGTTLTITETANQGSGTFASWNISVCPPGTVAGALIAANNLSDLVSASTARTNLGLGTAATQNTGTSANSVVKLDSNAKLPAVDGSQLTNINSGSLVQSPVYTQNASYDSTSTAIPYTNSVPTTSTGKQCLSAAITPKSASNRLIITYCVYVGGSSGGRSCAALFQSGSTNAVSVVAGSCPNSSTSLMLTGQYSMLAGTTSAITFSVNYGDTSGTLYLNGNSGGMLYGGAAVSSMTIMEVTP